MSQNKVDWGKIERHIDATVEIIEAMKSAPPSTWEIQSALRGAAEDGGRADPPKWKRKATVRLRIPDEVIERVGARIEEAKERLRAHALITEGEHVRIGVDMGE